MRRLVRRGLVSAFGPPPFDATSAPGDPGLFGPGSATWRLLADTATIVGGVRALLVQLLHPLAIAGIVEHSNYRTDTIGRLHHTAAYVLTVGYGAVPDVLAVSRRVRAVHRRVVGTAPDGRPYRADSPDLLTWVSTSLTESFLATDQAYGTDPLDAAGRDAFVREQARGAALLDPRVDLDALRDDPTAVAALQRGDLPLPLIDEGLLPTTVAELTASFDRYRGELHLDEQGRDARRFLLWPDLPPGLRAAYVPVAAAAAATLTATQRDLLGLPANRLTRAGVVLPARAALTALRLAVGSTEPSRLAGARVAAAPPAG